MQWMSFEIGQSAIAAEVCFANWIKIGGPLIDQFSFGCMTYALDALDAVKKNCWISAAAFS